MRDISGPFATPPSTILLCSLNTQSSEWRNIIVWTEDCGQEVSKARMRVSSESLTENQPLEDLLTVGYELDVIGFSPLAGRPSTLGHDFDQLWTIDRDWIGSC